jgi:hypothetical protein
MALTPAEELRRAFSTVCPQRHTPRRFDSFHGAAGNFARAKVDRKFLRELDSYFGNLLALLTRRAAPRGASL